MRWLLLLIFMLGTCSLSAGALIDAGSATDKVVAAGLSQTSQVVGEIVHDTISVLKDAKNFVLDQAPKVIKEFLVWRMTQCAFWLVFGLLLVGLTFIASWRIVVNTKPGSEERALATVLRWAVAPLLFFAFVGPNVYEMLYIYLAPRVYLIENVAYLLKYGTIQP